MLPAAHRLTDPSSYRRVLRRGRRRASRTVVVTLAPPAPAAAEVPGPVRVGLVVSKAVGNAVVRNRVKRRLRHLAAARLGGLEPGTDLVVRALPASATASSARLGRDLDGCLERCLAPRDTPRDASVSR